MKHRSINTVFACLQHTSILSRVVWCRPYQALNRHQMALIVFILILLCGSFLIPHSPDALAANPGPGKVCHWYRIVRGDTLSHIALRYGDTIRNLAQVNSISNVNLIRVNQKLCIPSHGKQTTGRHSGLLADGTVRWYAYNALDYSNQDQVVKLLRKAAKRYRLPANLMLAIAWQESGWNHHVIAKDGGIGLMQIMPYTAQGLNTQVKKRLDPYKLRDNIELSAIYLQTLWRGFDGDVVKVISAYNQGGWSVRTRGIFNWGYVNSVLALMKRY